MSFGHNRLETKKSDEITGNKGFRHLVTAQYRLLHSNSYFPNNSEGNICLTLKAIFY